MVEWIAILVTADPYLVKDFKSKVVHVTGFTSKADCETKMDELRKIAHEDTHLSIRCIQRRKFKQWIPKHG